MLKRVFLAIAGLTNSPSIRGPLNLRGIEDTVKLGQEVKKTTHIPEVIFSDGEQSAVQSAYLMAGVVGARAVVHDPRLAKGSATAYPSRHHDKPDPFRENFRTPRKTRVFLNKKYPIDRDIETVLFMTDCCWGLTFGGTWPRSSLYVFDLIDQRLDFVASCGGSI